MTEIRRREFLAQSALAAGALAFSPAFLREALAAPAIAGASPYGPLQPPNSDNLMLPPGFTSREIARGGQSVAGYPWHIFSDGGATFRAPDGGWIYVSNGESLASTGAGASAIRFRPDGEVAAAYRILAGTHTNCAGGPTPWGTWLSCEEHDGGQVWECDPTGARPAQARPAMGTFNHEAAAVDPVGRGVYLTEDKGDGGFYRFTPTEYPDLSQGLLEVAVVAGDGSVQWRQVPNPISVDPPTRAQVPGMTEFDGGEGAWYAFDTVYFTTKGDKRVWAYSPRSSSIEVLYDGKAAPGSSLDAVDNVTVTGGGDIYVCEDGGNMELGLITAERTVSPFLRFVGPAHEKSEVAGVAFDPSGTRMYLASQGAYPTGVPRLNPLPSDRGPGAVFEIRGPFRGPPGPAFAARAPRRGRRGLLVRAARRIRRASLLRRGLLVRVDVREPGTLRAVLHSGDLARVRPQDDTTIRPKPVVLARFRRRYRRPGRIRFRLKLGRRARRRLARRRRSVTATLTVAVRTRTGQERIGTRRVVIAPARRRLRP